MNEDSSDATSRPVFWTSMAIGGAVTLFGVIQAVRDLGSALGSFIPWFAGGAILLDLAIVPAAAAVGHLSRKVLPPWSWPSVRAGLLVSAVLVAFVLPLILGLEDNATNPTVAPRHYGSGLLAALVVTWLITAAALGLTAAADRRHRGSLAT